MSKCEVYYNNHFVQVRSSAYASAAFVEATGSGGLSSDEFAAAAFATPQGLVCRLPGLAAGLPVGLQLSALCACTCPNCTEVWSQQMWIDGSCLLSIGRA
jgi:hypothetical protein